MSGACCASVLASAGTVGCDLTISIWVSRKESSLSERGFVHFGVHVCSSPCPHTGTLSCATLWYCLVPWAPWWGKSNFSSSTLVCSRSACLGGSLPVSNPSKPDSLCLLNACACRLWKPVQQFLSNLILLPKDKIIQGFEEAWATPQCNDPVGEAWKISLWESTCSCKTRVKILGIQNY